jgi:hypothetical protein
MKCVGQVLSAVCRVRVVWAGANRQWRARTIMEPSSSPAHLTASDTYSRSECHGRMQGVLGYTCHLRLPSH